ncbi:MAG: ATP-binding protein [Alphaproteobacteria bacterium]|nr:ATP-binding protein [Alphaproteobacteria bacterium]
MGQFMARRVLLDRIDELQRSAQHISVVGPRAMGKTALLREVVARHQGGSDLFAGAALVDLRHDPPTSSHAALCRVAAALSEAFKGSGNSDLIGLAEEVDLDAEPQEIFDQLKLTLEWVADLELRVLLVLDGCDTVLQNPAIPRNLWDNLRALAQTPAKTLRLMTGSRDQLHKLCYNPEARTSDFFRIFWDEPLFVGPFDEGDWKEVFDNCGIDLDGSARKEMANWTGGHPDLVALILERLDVGVGARGKPEVDGAAEAVLASGSGRLASIWMDCSDDSRGDIVRLAASSPVLASEFPTERLRFLTDRGIAAQSGNKVHLTNRLVARIAEVKERDVSGARRLFEAPEDFRANIRSVLDLRVAQVEGGDGVLMRLLRRALQHLPDDPGGTLGSARDVLDRALDLIWTAELPDGRVPTAWIDHWKFSGRMGREIEDYARNPEIPEERGRQCGLLRLATGQQRLKPVTQHVSKSSFVLIEHIHNLGNLKNHSSGEPSVTLAVSFVFAAIELTESLARELP